MPGVRRDFGAHTNEVDGHIYVIGGWNGASNLDDIVRYSISTNTWSTIMTGIASPRRNAIYAGAGPLIYEFGGLAPVVATNSCRVHDTTMRTTTNITATGSSIIDGDAVVVPDRILANKDYNPNGDHEGAFRVYYFGGERAGAATADISYYDPTLDTHTDRSTIFPQVFRKHKMVYQEGAGPGGALRFIRTIGG